MKCSELLEGEPMEQLIWPEGRRMVEKSFLNRQEDESPEYKPLTAIKLNAFNGLMAYMVIINLLSK